MSARLNSLGLLEPCFRTRLDKLFAWMVKQGEDPVAFETLRTITRQRELYAVGRTTELDRKPITWTLESAHLPTVNGLALATDVISKEHFWNDERFFVLLKQGAKKFGLETIKQESCHVQYPRSLWRKITCWVKSLPAKVKK